MKVEERKEGRETERGEDESEVEREGVRKRTTQRI